MSWVAICERLRARCGKDLNESYVNVVKEARNLKNDTAAGFPDKYPDHPWSNPASNEFLVDIPDDQGEAILSGAIPLFWDGQPGQPRWQNKRSGTGSPFLGGSFKDPSDERSGFTPEAAIPDTRFVVRLYDNPPENIGVHIASLDLIEESGHKPVYIKLFDSNDKPLGTNGDHRIEIAGRLMKFTFTKGVATFAIDTVEPGRIAFHSNYKYRVVGPAGERSCTFRIYGNTLRV